MKDLKNKYGQWALITGASSGIGEQFALRLAEKGMNVALVARREDRLNSLSDKIKEKYKVDTLVIPVDLSDDNFLSTIVDALGGIDIGMLINNAGFGSTGEFVDNDPASEADMIKVNCLAPVILTHNFVPIMKEKGRGAVIFLGSVAGFQATPMMTAYSATKVFNRFLGNGLWYELKKYGIDVLSLNPGGTNTEFQRIADVDTGPFSRSPEQVVETGLKALGKKMEVVDGAPNKIMAVFSKLLPMQVVVRIAGKTAEKMYNDYRNKK